MLFASITTLFAQNNFTAKIVNEANQPLHGVLVQIVKSNISSSSNTAGIVVLNNIPSGRKQIRFSLEGKATSNQDFEFPLIQTDTLTIVLSDEVADELEEVVIQSTRARRSIRNNPTRVETIEAEEIDEKSNMRPSNVTMVLHESTGIQVQQTSATSGNASIRVQGLDGRYTQLLKDGYPNFGNFAGGLSILEIPPLDLKQVEIIKGPASTLYGGGAIAGVVNFISKTPQQKAEYKGIINQSNIGQSNIGFYASQKVNKLGYAILGLYNKQTAFDVDNDNFSEISKSYNFTINPRLYYYFNENTTLMIGNSFTQSDINGGDMTVINDKPTANNTYFENNNTTRNTTTAEFDHDFSENQTLKIKQSFSVFDRSVVLPNYIFSGFNENAFTDVSYFYKNINHTFISGINFVYDNFEDSNNGVLNAKTITTGGYVQHTYDISEKIVLESGLRLDRVKFSNANFSRAENFILPRISALFKISDKLNTRIGGGFGYKAPTIFTEQTETIQYQNVVAINNASAEKSIGGTFDVNYNTSVGNDFTISANQMFFYTQINQPLVLQPLGTNVSFENASKPIITAGFETNLKVIYQEHFKFFVGYTFTEARAKYLTGNQFLPLLPQNKLNLCLLYEKEDNFKFGLEGYMTDTQFLTNGTQTPRWWEFGFMVEKTLWEHYAFFINFENFTDTRQSRYKRVVNGPNNNPTFDEIWTHTEGFVFNGGVKFKL